MVRERLRGYDIIRYVMIIVAVVLIVFIARDYTLSIRQKADSIVVESLSNQINQSNKYLKKYLDKKVKVLQNVSSSVGKKDFKTVQQFEEYTKIVLDGQQFDRIRYIDKNGYLHIEDGTLVDVRDKSYYIQAMSGNFALTNPTGDSKHNYQGIGIVTPIYDENSNIIGALYAEKDSAELMEELESEFSEYIGFAYVINKDGYVIFKAKNNFQDEECINFFHYMVYQGIELENYVETLRTGMSKSTSDVLVVSGQSGKGYLGYAPISSEYGWTVVSYIGDNKISDYGNNVSKDTLKMMSYIISLVVIIAIYIMLIEVVKNKQIKKMAFTDPLTSIGNCFWFENQCKKILKLHQDEKYVVVQFDIKRFKYINHKYGYSFGDKILKLLAKNLNKKFNKGEACARIGTDLFIILLKNSPDVNDKLNKYLQEILVKKNITNITLNFRMGLYVLQDNNEAVSKIIEKVNLAWNYIKNGSNSSFNYYDDDLLDKIMEEEALEFRMRGALDNREFKVYVQPKIDLKSDKMCGAEALVRWISPELGFMPPDKFIPLFEKNGFIANVDFYVLESIFIKTQQMIKEGYQGFTISVNQSRETLNDPNYLVNLKKLIDKYDVPVNLIELEITENVFVDDYDKILDIMKKVKALGFKISMDDFGSGYSSLNLLKEMPINVLKIDRIFLNETKTSAKSKVIIKSVIQMAKNLEINVICEGVENIDQVKLLKEIKCEMAQGYYYGKPMPMEEFDKKLKEDVLA